MGDGNLARQAARSSYLPVREGPPRTLQKGQLTQQPTDTLRHRGHGRIRFTPDEIDVRLIDLFGAARVLREGILPLRKAGELTIVAAIDPAKAEAQRERLEEILGPVILARASRADIEDAVTRARQGALSKRSEERTAPEFSCRYLGNKSNTRLLAVFAIGLTLVAVAFPVEVFAALVLWASFCLCTSTILRLTATVANGRRVARPAPPQPNVLPRITLLVPLFREKNITGRLVRRLTRLDYPASQLDICLIVEKHDTITRAALGKANLAPHTRQVVVPPGGLQTKPRAMNYALDFARGDIIGVYDAEDRPAPDQLRIVAAEFAAAAPDVACLQGQLDFYNPRSNWLSRCFTIDYAIWFRTILPGLARLGLPVPLGGTTLFFRRDVLERIGAWDAHNVTEDADLGIRLARLGWRTQLIDTTTDEEANCKVWPWIKQRSRWIKGYGVTWAVHMRRPRRLWSDLGAWKFLGFQIVFLGSFSQFLLAPFLWSFWLLLFGLPHPLTDALPRPVLVTLGALFFTAEVCNVAIGAWSCRGDKHRSLIPWVPTMHFYFPLAAIASWKGFWEIARQPFFWDKTDHGAEVDVQEPPSNQPRHPVSTGSQKPSIYAPSGP